MTAFYKPPSCELKPEDKKPKLKECPMCGSVDVGVDCMIGGYSYWGYCRDCECKGWSGISENEAAKNWNSLPRRSEVKELLRLVDECDCSRSRSQMAVNVDKLAEYADKLRKELGL